MRKLLLVAALTATLFTSLVSSAGATTPAEYCAALRPYTQDWTDAHCWVVLGMPQYGTPPTKHF